jgi:hypothetical protein
VSHRRYRCAELRWGDEVQEELARAIDRGGQRLGRLIAELEELAREIDRLELTLFIPGLSAELGRNVRHELDLATAAFNALHDAALCTYQQLICQRERCGFRDHKVIESCFRIPDLPSVIEPDLYELRE